MYDNIAEAIENVIVELRNNDSAVTVPAGGDIVIIDIWDMPNPFGKELNVYKFLIRGSKMTIIILYLCLSIIVNNELKH
jgi:hypothetical protein